MKEDHNASRFGGVVQEAANPDYEQAGEIGKTLVAGGADTVSRLV